jgi:two-component system OmpR family response regulator
MEPTLRNRAQIPMMDTRVFRIFLVEDSSILRERLADMLAVRGDVEIIGHADSEEAAVAALQTQQWDMLIVDLQLLHGTGLGVLRALSGRRNPDTTVIVLTNYAIPSYRTHSMQLGADYFFDKAREFGRIVDVLDDIAKRGSQSSAGGNGASTH